MQIISMLCIPEKGRLDDADSAGVPFELLGHWQDGNAHVHPIHVTKHEGEKAKRYDRPSPHPSTWSTDNLEIRDVSGLHATVSASFSGGYGRLRCFTSLVQA